MTGETGDYLRRLEQGPYVANVRGSRKHGVTVSHPILVEGVVPSDVTERPDLHSFVVLTSQGKKLLALGVEQPQAEDAPPTIDIVPLAPNMVDSRVVAAAVQQVADREAVRSAEVDVLAKPDLREAMLAELGSTTLQLVNHR